MRFLIALQQALTANEVLLTQKISILALMELAFKRPSDQRTIAFPDIATATKLPVKEVEPLVMKALSLKLVKGSIDEVDQTFSVTWVQPRVLDILCFRLKCHASVLFPYRFLTPTIATYVVTSVWGRGPKV